MARSRRTTVGMLDDVADEQRTLADQLATLEDHEWDVASLCGAWSVKEVTAHLTLSSRETMRELVVPLLRARGDFDRVNADRAVRRARQFSTQELIAQLREMAGVDRKFLLSGRLDPLVDVLVHGQDIVRPLGRARDMPLHRVVPSLAHVWGSPFLRPAKRFDGIRFIATDAHWSGGAGDLELRAPAANLLLLATGRPTGLDGLDGAAVDEVATRLQA